ncbi:fructose-bisphosphate aldolase [Acididesulfobacillus acetoxydans]|uniref:D-tagatose-1,6-bisphosphate aldolase subunit GatY n=1 Tax=Acididesulfobacillus acetoxydans TaxID=1561005 RepID=A0A8S0WVP0_9FIRM|nr:class II fructose-1,6-bisphosphate aldolase [Acididesulfobacillus acetoxydans]CAA7599751.1 fructose-bisphosphate aldolase [Acididesulfobacillus acetoxydans]CEJ06302.1 D-tagatose-1,6-bisphosphate aldolase subunit GatY [Acididesulfobacillus acetoxydans]
MSLVPVTGLLREAQRGHYAVGAFNCNNMEIVQAIVAAAEAEQAPVIIQASQGAIKYAGVDYIGALARLAAERANVPVALHLDHGTGFAQVMQCVRNGFTSVMIDGSKLPLPDNIALTNKVIEAVRPLGLSVEAELGKIGGTEDDISVTARDALFTDPEEAAEFVRATGVDSLAVAIGTAHGRYQGVPKLDYERLRRITARVSVPIVLHGSSGVPDEAIQEAIALGVCKVNIDTNIREAFVSAARGVLAENPGEIDPRKVLGPAREAATEVIRGKIRIFGTCGKARNGLNIA